MQVTPDELYEQARSAGVSHETATELRDMRPTRAAISGNDWGATPDAPTSGSYSGPAPTIDAILWLRKVGMSLWSPPVMRFLVARELPIVINCRTRAVSWWKDGCLELDLQHRQVGGRRIFTTCRVPVEACLAHDQKRVLQLILAHLGERTLTHIEAILYNETDLRHVSG